MSDHPDWTDSSVISSQSQSLFVDTAPVALPAIQTFDVSLFASIDVSVQASGTAADHATQVLFTWSVAGNVIAEDQITFWNTQTATGAKSPLVNLPCRGDSLQIQYTTNAGPTTIFRVITGSTRAVDKPSLDGYVGISPGALGGGQGFNLAAGGTDHYYFGPVAGLFDLAFGPCSQSTRAIIEANYYDNAGVYQSAIILDETLAANTSVRTLALNAPFVALTLLVISQVGVVTAYNFAITGG